MAFPSTFQGLQLDVIGRLNLDATADLSYVKDLLNQAYAEVCAETEALQTSGTKTLTAGTASYDVTTFVSGAIQRIKGIQITSGGVVSDPLKAVSLDEILRRRAAGGGTATATGTSTLYALVGAKTLELFPTPASADTMTLWYSYLPTALSANSDVPDAGLPEPYATRCLIYGACAQAADLTGDPEGPRYQAMADQWKGKLRAHLNRRRSGQPGAFTPFRPGPYVPHDPSTIVSGW